MKRFIAKVLIFSFLLASILYLLSLREGITLDKDNYLAAIIDKHDRLVKSAGRRIILVGDSNIAFGIDSKLIEDNFRFKVINMGLHGMLGLDFPLNEVKSYLRAGDVVILCFAWMPGEGDYGLKMEMTKFFPEARKYFKHNLKTDIYSIFQTTRRKIDGNIQNIFDNYLLGKKKKKPTEESITFKYTRKGFNEYGDEVSHLSQPSLFDAGKQEQLMNKYEHFNSVKYFNDFYNYAIKKGTSVFFAYPCFPTSLYKPNRLTLEQYHDDLKNHMLVPILGTPASFIFNDSLFFDTSYHLGREAREERTKILIDLMKKNNILHATK